MNAASRENHSFAFLPFTTETIFPHCTKISTEANSCHNMNRPNSWLTKSPSKSPKNTTISTTNSSTHPDTRIHWNSHTRMPAMLCNTTIIHTTQQEWDPIRNTHTQHPHNSYINCRYVELFQVIVYTKISGGTLFPEVGSTQSTIWVVKQHSQSIAGLEGSLYARERKNL